MDSISITSGLIMGTSLWSMVLNLSMGDLNDGLSCVLGIEWNDLIANFITSLNSRAIYKK